MNNLQEHNENVPLLELRDIKSLLARYNKLDVLVDASLTVSAGEMKALVGPSGSGKSTLLNIAGLLEQPDAGEVLIDGMDASKLSRSKRGLMRRSIHWVCIPVSPIATRIFGVRKYYDTADAYGP